MKVLLLDNRESRRRSLCDRLRKTGRYELESYSSISQAQFEGAEFEFALVHLSNPEADDIQNGIWSDSEKPVIYFSGGLTSDFNREGKDLYISETKLVRDLESIDTILEVGV